MKTHFYVIAYDISDNHRRSRLAKRLEQIGDRVQDSVFECELTITQLAHLKRDLEPLCKLPEDNLRLYRLCNTCLNQITLKSTVPLKLTPDYYLL